MIGVNNILCQESYAQTYTDLPEQASETSFCSAVDQRVQEAVEMEQFKREFWEEVASIPKTSTMDNLAINITREGWERMKADPEYREKMMNLIRRDTTGAFIFPVDCVITIGATDEEYRASSWSSERGDFWSRTNKDSYIERRKKRKKQLQEIYEKQRNKRQLEKKLQEQRRLAKIKGEAIPAGEIFRIYEDMFFFV